MKSTPTSRRTEKILKMLAGREDVSVAELRDHFQVAAMTIRRDLDMLAKQGRITRTHGGAMLAAPSVVAFEFQQRQRSHLFAKSAIAQAAAKWVTPGMKIILDTGTTTLELAHRLGGIEELTVLTSSLAIASALLAHNNVELVLLGGTVSKGSPDLSGPLTLENLATFRAELAFVGADGADEDGFYTSDLSIAQVCRAMIANAGQSVLVVDSSKFSQTSFVRIAGWEAIDRVITDDGLGAPTRRWIREKVAGHTFVPFDPKETP